MALRVLQKDRRRNLEMQVLRQLNGIKMRFGTTKNPLHMYEIDFALSREL